MAQVIVQIGMVRVGILPAGFFVLGELVGMNEFNHRQMLFGGLEVLAHGEDIATHRTQVIHCLLDLVSGFAQTEHESAFRSQARLLQAA